MSDAFLEELRNRLDMLGVRGSAAERVLVEARDHVQESSAHGVEDATRRFGDLDEIARQIAAELATARTRRATFAAFAALALFGVAKMRAHVELTVRW